jgi:hypothetical protein
MDEPFLQEEMSPEAKMVFTAQVGIPGMHAYSGEFSVGFQRTVR